MRNNSLQQVAVLCQGIGTHHATVQPGIKPPELFLHERDSKELLPSLIRWVFSWPQAGARTIEMPLLVLNVCICETVCLGRLGVDAVQQKPYRLPELLSYPQYPQGGSCTVRVTKNRFYVLPQVIRNSNS